MMSKSEFNNFCLRKSGTSEVSTPHIFNGKNEQNLEMPGIEPGAFHMQTNALPLSYIPVII